MDFIAQLEYTRRYTDHYVDALKDQDWYITPEVNGVKLNSVAWIVGHIVVSQNFLQNYCLGMPHLKITWARDFGMGSVPLPADQSPSQKEILETMVEVMKNTVSNIKSLDPSLYPIHNPKEFKPPLATEALTYEQCIYHGLWHESGHAGQLAAMHRLFK